jgi:hypothetical protein
VLYPMIELTPVAVLQDRMTQASRKGNHILSAQEERSRIFHPDRRCGAGTAAVSSISRNSRLACCGVRERSSASLASSFLPRRKSQRGDSVTSRLPSHKQNAGRKGDPEDAPPSLVLETKKRLCVGGGSHRLDAIAVSTSL